VKKGGEAIFRKFLEDISSEENERKLNIDRNFYELLISKIILFKSLEEIHGARNNAIGQLRSAVVPYTMSILFSRTEGDKKNQNTFDLARLWAKEGLEDDLKVYLKELMILVNDLIKKYTKSDDLGEYSKKKELWDDIYSSNEIKNFLITDNSKKIFNKYSISKKDLGKKIKDNSKNKEVDFSFLKDNVDIHYRTTNFYKNITSSLDDSLSTIQKERISYIISLIQQKKEISTSLIEFNKNLLNSIRINHPEILDSYNNEYNELILISYNYIKAKYNGIINQNEDIEVGFNKIGIIANQKDVKYSSVFNEIGKSLAQGLSPTIDQLFYSTNYISTIQQ